MDEFSSVLQRLSSLHTAQVQALSAQLEEEQRARRGLEEKIEVLKNANDDARKSIEHAKKKVSQQAQQIRELKKKLQNNGQEEDTPASYGEPSSPAATAEEGAARLDHPSQAANTDTHRLNQTCATLFESPAPVDGSKVSMSEETPARSISKVRGEESFLKGSGEEERERGGETMDYHRGESIETVAGDVIIVDDVTGNNHPEPACSSSKSAVDPPEHDRVRTRQSVSIISGSSLPPSGPVHMVYSHAHAYSSDVRPFGEENEQSPKKNTTRPLSLRDAGANKVKWKEVSSTSLTSTSATSSNLSDTKPPLSSPDKTGSPGGDESEGTSASSSPEQSSPSLLGASNSPWKLQQSNSSSSRQLQQSSSTSTPVNMTHSLFARTNHGSVVMTTPASMLKLAIPPSDSQFSLDVSQSAPLSPELCPLITPTQKTHPPPPKAIPAGSAISMPPSKDTPVPSGSVDCSVVPITPGVPSVNKILQGRKRWTRIDDQSPASEKTAAALASSDEQISARKSISGGKRGQEQVDFEDEDILPQSKVHRLTSMNDTAASHTVNDDHTRLEYEQVMDSEEEEEGDDSPMSPVLVYPKSTAKTAAAAATSRISDTTSVSAVQGQGMANNQSYRSSPQKPDHQRMLERAGLPTGYKFDAPIRKKADRDKLEGKACPDCQAWFAGDDGIHGDVEDHLRRTCRHKHLYLPPDEDSRIWNISFPDTEECENIMNKK